MRDIYELLNGIEVKTSAEDTLPVSEMEKKKVIKQLQHQIRTKKKRSYWKRMISAAIITFGLIGSLLVGLSFTSYAEDVPFLGNIFNFFSHDGHYVTYDEQAEKLDLVAESNGITLSIQDTVFDGRTLYITFMIETEKDLGETPWLNSLPRFTDTGMSGTERVTKIDEGKYIGVLETNHYAGHDFSEIEVEWIIDGISTEPNLEGTVFEGDWEFYFTVQATESRTIAVDNRWEIDGMTVTMDEIKITPMSFMIYYNHSVTEKLYNDWDFIFVEMNVEDDLGNVYPTLALGGYGDTDFDLNWMATYGKVDPDATQLILTPVIELSNSDTIGYDEDGNPIKASYRSVDSDADQEVIELEPITVEVK